jgi:transcriptional regulator with XRE-family HTH domain
MIPCMTSPTSQAVAGTIRAELARRRLSQRDLAQKLAMSQSSLNRRLTGAQAWDLDELHRVAELLEIDARDLLPAAAVTTTP